MDILQHAVLGLGRDHAQVGPVALVPGLGQIAHGQTAFEHGQLEVEADHDVEVVGHLVGVGADERALDLVDRPVELLEGHRAELLGEGCLEQRVVVPPEGARAADQVLPQARLALVDARGGAAGQDGAVVGRVDALLVHGVPRLVQGAEEALGQVVLVEAGGDAHIAAREPDREGVGGLVLAPPAEVVAEVAGDLLAEGLLLSLGEVAAQAAIVGGRPLGDRLGQGHQARPQGREERAHRLGLHAIVGAVDQRVGDMGVAGEAVGHAPAQLEGSLEVGQHSGDIVGGAGFGPGVVAGGALGGDLGDQGGGDARAALEAAAGHPDQGRVVAVEGQALLVGRERLEQLAEALVGGLLVAEAAQGGGLAAAGGGPAGGHIGVLVPGQHGGRRAQVVDLDQASAQLAQLLLHCCLLTMRARSAQRPGARRRRAGSRVFSRSRSGPAGAPWPGRRRRPRAGWRPRPPR